MQRLSADLGRIFEGFEDGAPLLDGEFIPLADVEETDDAFIVEVELPGVKKDDVDISVAGRRLEISGERKEKERVGILRRQTRSVGRFRYEIVLPSAVDESGITATLDDGVLTVRVPKASSERPRRIEVK
jgi:HSP20 family protein